MTSVELRLNGPHTSEYTAEVAGVFTESIRVLNHATQPQAGGLRYPSDVYAVLGRLVAGVERIPQLLRQLGAFLEGELDADRVGEDAAGRHAGDAVAAVIEAGIHLQDAASAADALAAALRETQSATSGLHHLDPDTGTDGTNAVQGGDRP